MNDNSNAQVVLRNNDLVFSGPINFHNVSFLLNRCIALLMEVDGDIRLDLKDVTDVTSAALALLIELKRNTSKAGKTIRIDNLPDDLQQMMHVYGLNTVLSSSE